VTRDEQLSWEARWGRPVAVGTFLAGVLTLFSTTTFIPKNRTGVEATPDLLLSIHEDHSGYMTSSILSALAALFLTATFYYLFRAIDARGGGIPRWFVYIVIAAPIAYAVSRVIYAIDAIDIADEFASGTPIRGAAGGDRAKDISDISPVVLVLQTAGTVGVAFLFVMLPLRARRVGLLTPFMSILGVIAGALIVFPFASISSIVQAFWLGALGALLLGRWPGGRGPAWESGEAEPWPTAAQRRADLVEQRQLDTTPPTEPEDGPEPKDGPEPEEAPERPPSRKRKRKRR
jgi:hypothetical protein